MSTASVRTPAPRLPKGDPRYEIEAKLWTPHRADRATATALRWIKIRAKLESNGTINLHFVLQVGSIDDPDGGMRRWRASPLYAPPKLAWREITQLLADHLGYTSVPQSWLDAMPTRNDLKRCLDDFRERHDVEVA